MKWILISLTVFIGSSFLGYKIMGAVDTRFLKGRVLSESVENIFVEPSPTPVPTSTPTPVPTSTPTPTPSPTSTPTPTVVPQPKVTQEEIHHLMERFAGQYSVDVNVLRYIATCESGFNSNAVNGKYAGLFQFDKTTWKNNRANMGEDADVDLRFNAEESTQTAAYMMSIGKTYIWPNCYP